MAFPGQGITRAAVADALTPLRHHPLVRSLAALAGTNDWTSLDVNDTRVAQPAVYVAGLVTARERIDSERVAAVIGHSLGELTALAFSGAVDDEVGLHLAHRRGRLCHAAQEDARGGMVAIMGLDLNGIEFVRRRVVGESTGGMLDVAAVNSEHQIVLSGDRQSVEDAIGLATRLGAVASELPIGGAFHSPMMVGAAREFRDLLASTEVRKPSCVFVSTIRARALDEPDDVRDALGEALLLPVRWVDGIECLASLGVEAAWEAGPGRTLTKLARRIDVVPFLDV